MTSPGTPLPTRRPVWSLTQPCKRRVSATSFLRGNRGTEELRYLPEIPQQGRGPWGSRRLHSGTRLPFTPPQPPRHLPLLSSRGQRRLPPAVGAAEPPFGMLHFGRTEKPRRPPVPSGLEAFRLRLSRRALPCPSASPATAVARTKHQRHENGPNGPESEARTPRSLPQGTRRGARAAWHLPPPQRPASLRGDEEGNPQPSLESGRPAEEAAPSQHRPRAPGTGR